MRVSYRWLNTYIDLKEITPQQLAEKLTFAGLEVEGIEPMAQAEGLVIGYIEQCEDIPDTHLRKTQVVISENPKEVVQIVCGAPNCRQGLKVIVALPNAKLPKGTILAKPVHGVESHGMLCALNELGVDPKYLRKEQVEGIEELPEDAPIGCQDVLAYIGYDDTILDVSLTPNRADCSAMWNLAYEVGAILKKEVHLPSVDYQCALQPATLKVSSQTDKCDLFLGKIIHHLKIGPSPKWIVDCLHAYGMHSINNVVDISNLVMLETGQPLHFYNLAKIPDRTITVVDGLKTQITALDGVTFEIEPEDIMITTNGQPTGIAGIMGGEESMIDEQTTGIIIEAAHFKASQVRKSANRLNLLTEAATRFAKGIDPQAAQKAIDRSVQLLIEYAQATEIEETVQYGQVDTTLKQITETLDHCNALLGTSYTMETLKDTLTWLNFKPMVDGQTITCTIPSYRLDIENQADIDEEIIRLNGYDSLTSTLPVMPMTVGQLTTKQSQQRLIQDTLIHQGFHQIVTYTLISQQELDDAVCGVLPPFKLAMPMSLEREYVRNSLCASVLECLQYNLAHQNTDNMLFELSSVYGQQQMQDRLAIALEGVYHDDPLHHEVQKTDFYTLKGILYLIFEKLGFHEPRLSIQENHKDTVHFHPYVSAEVYLDRQFIGIFGQVHPEYAKKYDLKQVYYAEIILDQIYQTKPAKIKYQPLEKYPSVTRDIAFVVAKEVSSQDILNAVRKAGQRIVHDSFIFDVYQGEHVQKGYKSIALRTTYQAQDHTLKEEEILLAQQAILDSLEHKVKAVFRK